MKEMVFVSAQPDDPIFSWQTELFIENIRSLGYTNQVQVLLFSPAFRPFRNPENRFIMLQKRYEHNNVKFFWYPDTANLMEYGITQSRYEPLLRPHILKRHFGLFPELKEKAIFYHDCDILFTKYIDFSPFLNDDICYLSSTRSYLGTGYFDSKAKYVKPELKNEYGNLDVLNTCASMAGINSAVCHANDPGCGGAQYLLKNITSEFWEEVEISAYKIRKFLAYELGGINYQFFNSEKEGFQSWCADMWALLWNLWKRNKKTVTPTELNFCWATDKIEKWDRCGIYHDAGVTTDNESYLFNKREPEYVYGLKLPFSGDLTHVSPAYCSSRYVDHILAVNQKYNYSTYGQKGVHQI
ncbi:hypothetical protein HGH93_21360 [Chitinophaga polysaccharea]|uniref:hypothetical protein n=1 Tax=Chitinophaga polysaccharea TaxID=1293035 RepID=UPI001454FF70|nr:hypothetical protein [Chitinophaga polysaccharea]NLR60672.1 hypothetical protein [Chitinophaga polysaccharea]